MDTSKQKDTTITAGPANILSIKIDTSLRPIWGFFAIFAIGFPLFFLFQPPLPEKYNQLSSIDLVNQNNESVDTTFFSKTPSIVNFVFTRCKDFCPALSKKMQFIQRQIPDARLVSISVDPEYDTPKILQEYGKRFKAGDSWFFLTGTRDQITTTNSAFQQAYRKNRSEDDTPNILHSQKFILVDEDGFIRGFYDDNSADIRLLIRDYHRLKRIF